MKDIRIISINLQGNKVDVNEAYNTIIENLEYDSSKIYKVFDIKLKNITIEVNSYADSEVSYTFLVDELD